MTAMYEPYKDNNLLEGRLELEIKEVYLPGKTSQPHKVIRNDNEWTIDVKLIVEGSDANQSPPKYDDHEWEVKAYIESFTGHGPEKAIGNTLKLNLKDDRKSGSNTAGYPTASWAGTITVPVTDNPTSEYEVCRVTVVAITKDTTTNKPMDGAHFATADDLVAIYQP